ncbi:MAG: hypothetical protein MJ123_01030 [Lachnospiraceae bacterium]|nr:hypothetical protein [Lachnospiraceae bacterium]
MTFDIEQANRGLMTLSFIFAKCNYGATDMIWIYKKGESDVLEKCIAFADEKMKKERAERIILLTDDDEVDVFQEFICKVMCSEQDIEDLIAWYMVGHPYNNIMIISLIYPEGRNGRKWIGKGYSFESICKHGLLRI